MKNLANGITVTRIIFAVLLLIAKPFSPLFWVWYVCGGVSDILDGHIARMLWQTSETGAKLDSAADFLFIMCVGIAVVTNLTIPIWVLISLVAIALVRISAYGVGYYKYRTFAALHTVLNKATGALLFGFPVLYLIFGMNAACGIVCGFAFFSSAEELILTIRSKDLDRNRKGLFL